VEFQELQKEPLESAGAGGRKPNCHRAAICGKPLYQVDFFDSTFRIFDSVLSLEPYSAFTPFTTVTGILFCPDTNPGAFGLVLA